MTYLPILIPVLGTSSLLFLLALDEFIWYRNWSRKRQFKTMKKYYKNNSRVTS